ncbi:MAG: indolepyruvate oxidoreductase subunit beta [Deltaproteobacteria bacterium]|nr:indolepyruvate oxidoreductase subunit beta [Deltaproteobacteria bacterium]
MTGTARPLRFVFCGVGGQGSLFASLLVGDAAMAAGLDVVLSEIHGMSQRGGSVVSTVVVGAAHGPQVGDGEADVLVAFEPLEALRAFRYCSNRTTAIVAVQPWVPPSVAFGTAKYPPVAEILGELRRTCARVVDIDSVGIAETCGSRQSQNMVVLGALAASGVLPFEDRHFLSAFRLRLPESAQDGVARAFEAGKAGRTCVAATR